MNQIKNILNTKAKRIIAGAGVFIVIVICVVAVYTMTKDTTPKLKVKEDSVVVEYGETIKLESKEYVDTKGIENKEEFLKKVKIESDIENEEGKEYPGIGIYEVSLKYEKQSVKVKIEVKDTTKPKFEEIEKIEIQQDEEINYEDYIKATDLQEITYTYDDKEVNRSVVGEYVVKVKAKDKSGNESSKEIKVIVKEKTEETEERNPEEGTAPKSNTSNEVKTHSSSNNSNQGGSSSGNSTTPSNGSGSGSTSGSSNSSSNTNDEPKFVLPSNTSNQKYFMTLEEAEAYAKQNNIGDYDILVDYDWKTDTSYCMLTIR